MVGAPQRTPRGAAVRRVLPWIVAALALAGLQLQAGLIRRHKSVTFDETFYANAALHTAALGRLDPQLARHGVAPLPVLVSHLGPALAAPRVEPGDPWTARAGNRERVGQARVIHAALVGSALLLGVVAWLWRRRGPWVAASGAVLLAASPTVVAHSAYATTDALAAGAMLAALAAMAAHARRPSRGRAAAVAVAVAVAVSVKYSALFLVPLAVTAVGWSAARRAGAWWRPQAWWRPEVVGQAALVLAAIPVLVWALHGFARVDGEPAPVVGIQDQVRHQREGHWTFFLGERSRAAGPAYFPVLYAAKSTPAELALVLAALVTLVLRWRAPAASRAGAVAPWLWAVAVVAFAALALTSRVNIGHRYLLPLYPLLVLLALDRLARLQPVLPRALPWLAGGLLAAQIASAAWIAPHQLAYFNVPSGGPARADRIVVDSSLDWGQDLVALARALEPYPPDQVVLWYHGTADPVAYGIHAPGPSALPPGAIPDRGVLAISATYLRGTYLTHDLAAPLRELEPLGRAGYSISLYDLGDPRVRAVVDSARTP